MFIYKITINEKVYIGLDTKPMYKQSRWKTHCREAVKSSNTNKLYTAMRSTNPGSWKYEVLESGFESVSKLALAEIRYIKKFDSFHNGLNSTLGGDGIGQHNLTLLSDSEILKIKETLGERSRLYNKNVKWANTSETDRKELTKHLNTPEVYKKRSDTLKEFYKKFPESKKEKSIAIKKWCEQNPEKVKARNRINSAKGAAKVSKRIKVELETGEVLHYPSKSDFQRKTGQWVSTIIQKTQQGVFHNGYKIWEVL